MMLRETHRSTDATRRHGDPLQLLGNELSFLFLLSYLFSFLFLDHSHSTLLALRDSLRLSPGVVSLCLPVLKCRRHPEADEVTGTPSVYEDTPEHTKHRQTLFRSGKRLVIAFLHTLDISALPLGRTE